MLFCGNNVYFVTLGFLTTYCVCIRDRTSPGAPPPPPNLFPTSLFLKFNLYPQRIRQNVCAVLNGPL